MYTNHRAQAFAAGADGFLRKGCPVDELLAAILGGRQRKHKDRMIRKTQEVIA
jgi:DNA-binding NarL/FixJ family response regulator